MISLIAAYARDKDGRPVIGQKGAIPWRLPEDMRWFRAHTMYKTLAMGRATYESLPVTQFNNRRIIVLSNSKDYVPPVAPPAVTVCHNWMELIERYEHPDAPQLVVCGGASVYAQLLPWAASVLLTEVHKQYDGDTFLPFDPEDLVPQHGFHLVVIDKGEVRSPDKAPEMEWTFKVYTRRHADDAGCP